MEKVRLLERFEGIAEIEICRPEKHNAIDFDVMEKMEYILNELALKKDLKAIVIRGNGPKTFCSGGDLSAFHSLRTKEDAYRMLSRMGNILYELAVFPFPVFALINGTAVGGGAELAAAADIRIARKGSKIGFIQGTLAITTGWGGGSLLFDRIRHDQAMVMLASSRIFAAEEAYRTGFVTDVLDDAEFEEEGLRYISELLKPNPDVLKAYKAMKTEQLKAAGLQGKMNKESMRCAELWEKDAHLLAADSFLANRKG
ncbi:enoyl-CoA hydratase/isomerase family protein [Metabacillus sp. GX 13764]|uniref:enoyl-CoA hydratase/isomerase family protein n=1 Tax=Metabacillus kandeliae TaxID=2900151 RepID=UPI001E42A9F2|nr:enoyl-CoA hydratase/isomerase family protein [Metabacillus kandeliae]MCD7033908.1 enoyl-CoA hydratase/isomerase family protein [Metabacillus kandeliae]